MINKQDLIKELFGLGTVSFNSGDLIKAGELFQQVITVLPGHIESLNYLGLIQKKLGNYKAAIEKFNLILMQGDSPEIYENIGLCLLQLGEFEKAENYFNKAVLLDQDYVNAYANLASVLQMQGKYEKAILNYRKYLSLIPDNPDIYNNIGLAFEAEGKYQEAENSFRQAIMLDQTKAVFFNNLASVLQNQYKYEESISCFNKAISLDQSDPDFFNNLAFSYQSLEQYDKAVENYLKAISIFPSNPDFFSNLGSVSEAMGNHSGAIDNYQKAIQLAPDREKYYYNLAVSLEKTGEYQQAINNYLQAIRIKPDYADARWNLSLVLLLTGEFKTGWKEYEWRFLAESAENMFSDKPRWNGIDPAGKSICIKHEQGLGDAIQFCRYLKLLKENGAKVVFECHPELKGLFKSLEGYDFLTWKNDRPAERPEYDFYLPLITLPLIFETTNDSIPASIPYLKADPELNEKWQQELSKFNGPKVGIVWSGNPQNKNNKKRSFPLSYFYELAEKLNIKFFSLQKGPASEQLKSDERIIDLAANINDFTDTAAIINNLDLVISVDTAVAHLAGAMGKKVWLLLPFTPDWRWQLKRSDSPWYPTMELFRQPAEDDWDSVFDKLSEAGFCSNS
jgi:tetratricopeptide (TPR) repeat protein